ncbi:MAG: hypothetical protein ABSG65_11725 [Bryobacteraceae bacterium]
MLRVTLLTYAPLAVLMAGSASAQTTLMVPATANIFAAGQSVAFSGTLPPVVTFAAGSVEAVTVVSIGKITLGAGEPYSGPAGIAFPGGTDLSSFDGRSGIIALDCGFFLTGVFLDDSVPAGSGPPILNFTGAEDFLTLRPQLFQTFFVGHGLTESGGSPVLKIFFVPPGSYTFLPWDIRWMRSGQRPSGLL